MKTVIVNDTTYGGHFGCKLVVDSLQKNLDDRGVEVLGMVPVNKPWKKYRSLMDQADLIVVNGEGSIHHGKRMDLLEVSQYYPSVLINAVYQKVPLNADIKGFKYVSARESLSQAEMINHGVDAHLVPDVIFTHDIPRPEVTEDLCIVDSCVAHKIGLSAKHPDFIRRMGRAARVCSGRFHGTCLAMLWGMPFAAYPSNTHKIEGMLIDAGCDLYFSTQEEALENIREFDATEYIDHARKAISDMLDQVVEYA